MKRCILVLSMLAAFAQACTTNTATPASNGVSNTNSPTSSTAVAANQSANNAAAPAKKDETSAPKEAGKYPQKSERVQFGGGKTDGYWTREIPAEGSIDFVIGAKKGQTMSYTVGYESKDSDVEAFLTEPGLQDIAQSAGPKEDKEFVVNKTGDHRLTVNNMSKKKITITLYLDIQ